MAFLPPGTNVTGGASVREGVVSWVPSCSVTSFGQISSRGARVYNLTTDYITDVSSGGESTC